MIKMMLMIMPSAYLGRVSNKLPVILKQTSDVSGILQCIASKLLQQCTHIDATHIQKEVHNALDQCLPDKVMNIKEIKQLEYNRGFSPVIHSLALKTSLSLLKCL